MSKRVLIKKGVATLEKATAQVHRLEDMDTKEVSVVDRAANKKKFLLVKRDGETDDEETTETPKEPKAETEKAGAPFPKKGPDGKHLFAADAATASSGDSGGAATGTSMRAPAPAKKGEGLLTREQHATLKAAVSKAHQGLAAVAKSLDAPHEEHVADKFTVASVLTETAEALKQALSGITKSASKEESMPPQAATMINTTKVGRPMQADRLNRLKSAMGMLKEAVADLRSGSSSMEKFNKGLNLMGSIIHECETSKSVGGRDQRGLSPYSPNVGAGVQPDVATVADASAIFGEGVPPQLGEILKGVKAQLEGVTKRLDESGKTNAQLAQELKKRDVTIDQLKGEMTNLKKTRVAPSTSPADTDEGAASSTGDLINWPTDMNSER